MKLIIKYSLVAEIKEAISVLKKLDQYQDLRSFIKPSVGAILSFAVNKNIALKHIQKVWLNAKPEVEKAFRELDIKDPGTMSCFLHGISAEGWFDTDDNSIHVRYADNGGDKELLNTIVYEIIHLSTYDKKYDYSEREEIVDKYLAKPQLKNIL
jgi:hypothetical protein